MESKVEIEEKEKNDSVVFDCDGCLGGNPFYGIELGEEYVLFPFEEKVKRIQESKPYEKAIEVMNKLYQLYNVYIVTGRCEDLRFFTEKWLKDYGFKYDELIMMPDQWRIVDEYFKFKIDAIDVIKPVIVFDDSSSFLIKVSDLSLKNALMIGVLLIKGDKSWNYNQIVDIIESVIKNRNKS